METKKDYYEILGIARGASPEEIKSAYRRLAKKVHPDVNPGDKQAEEKFKELSEAYAVLSDEKRRAQYDQFGRVDLSDMPGGGFGDFSDIGGLGDLFGEVFGDIFGGGRQRGGARSQRGRDLRVDVRLDFTEAFTGCDKRIKVRRLEKCTECSGRGYASESDVQVCAECGGSGQVRRAQGFFSMVSTCRRCGGEGRAISRPCRKCGGEGLEEQQRTIKVRVPAGVESGSRLRMGGEGEAGMNAGPNGDLYLVFEVEEHELFSRQGDDVVISVPISYGEAALGAELKVPTMEGGIKMKVPAGTQSGKVFRLRGKGVPHMGGFGRGDQLVEVVVETPVGLGRRERGMLEEFEKSHGGKANSSRVAFDKLVEKLFGSK